MNKIPCFGYLLLISLAISCSQISESYVYKNDFLEIAAENKYERLGRLHNEGLDYVLSELSKSKTKGQHISSDFIQNNLEGIVQKFIYTIRPEDSFQFSGTKGSVAPMFGEKANDIYDKATGILNQIAGETVEDAVAKLDTLKWEIESSDMSASEKEQLKSYIAVGSSSMQYWQDNFDRWAELLFPDSPSTKGAGGQKMIRIIIKDENGDAVIGACAMGVGSTVGVTTDIDGNCTFMFPSTCSSVTVSYVGVDSLDIPTNSPVTEAEVCLEEDSEEGSKLVIKKISKTAAIDAAVSSRIIAGRGISYCCRITYG